MFFDHMFHLLTLNVLIFALVYKVETRITVFGEISTNTDFYYRKLSKFPSKLAILEYSIHFNFTNINVLCTKGVLCKVILEIYTTENDQNLKFNCSKDGFGQLRNENLHTPLTLRDKAHRYTTCTLRNVDSDILQCEGKVTTQDYKPRHYVFSFGFSCNILNKPSLIGLAYNFTMSGQSNETHCQPTPRDKHGLKCSEFYDFMSLPNMFGDLSLGRWTSFSWIFDSTISLALAHLPKGVCYKYMKEVFCRVLFPQCDQVTDQVINICKETCLEFLDGCAPHVKDLSKTLNSSPASLFIDWRKFAGRTMFDWVDCNYLPSVKDPIPCYYKPVTCDPPAIVTNARIIDGIKPNETYIAKSQVEYECLNETFQMEGNSTVTCPYSGEWDKIPRCLKAKNKSLNYSDVNIISIVIPLLMIILFLLIITQLVKKSVCGRRAPVSLKRNRAFDAFVCYNFDDDRDFVFNSILPELEDNHDPPLRMLIHDRDFIPGREITINICNAIENCNSAIIVMSQGFVDSPRCREEFTKCLAEN